MYGISQSGKHANNLLHNFLNPFAYVPSTITPWLWKHLHRDLMFTLIVDNFGVRYTNTQDVEDFIAINKK